eukprot:gb/GFBE01041555.1/.p1 GENE.gb/GFBE01041555.1/~~gb/GFBE01041555.1/.p1  ORF type:complete len:680 (+),score=98.79 gb/GFBE01041555.1/:1-2040(+)
MGCQCSRRTNSKVANDDTFDGNIDLEAGNCRDDDKEKEDAGGDPANLPHRRIQEKESEEPQPTSPPQTPPTPSSAPRSPLSGFANMLRRPSLVSNLSKASKTSKASKSSYQLPSRQVSGDKVDEESFSNRENGHRGDCEGRSRDVSPVNRRKGSKVSTCSRTSNGSSSKKKAKAASNPPEAIAELLGKAVLHSGSLVQHTLRVRALQAFESLAEAYQGFPKADRHMPNFDMKVDPENLLQHLPPAMLKPNQLSLQRVSFMGTKWIALRLCQGSRAQCLKFCLCAAALQNTGKNTCRSVVVESQIPAKGEEKEEDIPAFVCSAIPTRENLAAITWLVVWEDVSELADIINNECGLPEKKVTAELKKWALKRRQPSNSSTKLRWSLFRGAFGAGGAASGSAAGSADDVRVGAGRRRSQSDVGVHGVPSPSADCGNVKNRHRRSSSSPEIHFPAPEEPQGTFTSVAKWLRKRISIRGVFSSLEDQLASLTPAPAPSPIPAGGRQPAGAGDDRVRSRSRSKSRSASKSKRRSGSKSSVGSVGSGGQRRRPIPPDGSRSPSVSSSDNEELAERSPRRIKGSQEVMADDQDAGDDASSEPSSPSSPPISPRRKHRQGGDQEPRSPGSKSSRRKSVSSLRLMPVVPESAADEAADGSGGGDDADEEEAADEGREEEEYSFRRQSSD